ncbi:MAG: hypothetical protein VXY53_02460, partial [Candidatus Thermoplasmatota archaeon]|nr:hypothetical protein [Candidatus Thermoplasmatota archaeon]
VYVDGGPNSKQEAIKELIANSKFPDAEIVCRVNNWGIGRHLIDARRRLFDELGYDRILLLEDDLVLGEHYVETVFKISDWAKEYDDIGTITAYNINPESIDDQAKQENQLIATNRHFWAYVITKQVWDEIKHIIYAYEQRFLIKSTYTNRAHRRIRWLFMRKWINKPRVSKTNCLVPNECIMPPFPKIPFRIATSQDAITALALWHHGYHRITTRVSRAEYIGIEGYSFSPEVYESQGFHRQNLGDYAHIETPTDFVFADVDEQGKPLKPTEYR